MYLLTRSNILLVGTFFGIPRIYTKILDPYTTRKRGTDDPTPNYARIATAETTPYNVPIVNRQPVNFRDHLLKGRDARTCIEADMAIQAGGSFDANLSLPYRIFDERPHSREIVIRRHRRKTEDRGLAVLHLEWK